VGTQFKCPNCGSVIYSRRHPICGRCGEELPESLMFDPATRNQLDALDAQDKKREEWEGKFPGHASSSGEYGPVL
jgi:hypothetical protein